MRPISYFNYLCGFLMLFAAAPLSHSQEAQIYFTSGGEFSLSSGGYRANYRGGSPDSGALSMRKDDIIQTGAGSFVELRLEPGGTRIKIAENTSLICNGSGPEAMSTSFSLLYGRIRISTTGIWPHGDGNTVFIRAGQVEAIFRQGDAGLDYIAKDSGSQLTRGEPVLTVYNFNGNSEVWPSSWLANSAPGSVSGFLVYEYESLTIETVNTLSYIERKALDNGIIQYWNHNNFSGGVPPLTPRPAASTAAAPQPVAAAESAAAPVQTVVQATPAAEQAPVIIQRIEYVYPDNPPTIIEQIFPDNPFDKRLFRVKNFLISTGMLFTISGIGMQVAGSYGIPVLDKKTNAMIANFGYAPMVMGLIFSGAALVIIPKNLVKNDPD